MKAVANQSPDSAMSAEHNNATPNRRMPKCLVENAGPFLRLRGSSRANCDALNTMLATRAQGRDAIHDQLRSGFTIGCVCALRIRQR
jgi:hypothetical protein